jgi:hypothetical protein
VIRSQNHLRVCLFIDGLDEYENGSEGSYSDMVSLFKRLTESGNFKVCLSSRPWLVFEDSFQSCPTLQLQHLTRTDIILYINDELASHERMTELRIRNPEQSDELIQEFVSKASGVFLWVKLVVKSLIDGFTNRDRISDLQKRLLLLPPDLENLYRHMFMNHIEPFYYEQSSRIFQVVCAAMAPSLGPLRLFTLSCTEEDGLALKAQLDPWSDSEISLKCHEMESRLKSRCMGLLEVSSPRYPDPGTHPTVGFIHRTAHEFLVLPEIWDLILSRTKTTFDPSLRLLEAHILIIKVSNSPANDFHYPERLQWQALRCALNAEKSSNCPDVPMLDELDRAATSFWLRVRRPKECSEHLSCHHYCNNFKPEDWNDFFSLAISHCLKSYVKAKLLQDNTLVRRKKGKPPLEYIFSPYGDPHRPDVELVSLLLNYGADPNQQYLNRSFWQYILGCVGGDHENNTQPLWEKSYSNHTGRVLRCYPFRREWVLAALKLFVEAGANPNALCHSVQSADLSTDESSKRHRPGPESKKFVVQLITPLCFFTPEGPLPDLELVNALKSRVAIEFMELRDLTALDEEGRRAEALKIRDEIVPKIKKLAEKSRSKGSWLRKFRMSWGNTV